LVQDGVAHEKRAGAGGVFDRVRCGLHD